MVRVEPRRPDDLAAEAAGWLAAVRHDRAARHPTDHAGHRRGRRVGRHVRSRSRAGRPLRRCRRPDAWLGRHRRTDPDRPRPPGVRAAVADHVRRGGGARRRRDGGARTGRWPRPWSTRPTRCSSAPRSRRSRSATRLVASSFEALDYAAGTGAGPPPSRRRRTPSRSGSWPCRPRVHVARPARRHPCAPGRRGPCGDRPRRAVGRHPSGAGAARRRQQRGPARRPAVRPAARRTRRCSVSRRSTRPSATRPPTWPGSTDPKARRRSGVVPTCRSGSAGRRRRPARPDAPPRADRRPLTPRPAGRPGHDRGADPHRRRRQGAPRRLPARAPTT